MKKEIILVSKKHIKRVKNIDDYKIIELDEIKRSEQINKDSIDRGYLDLIASVGRAGASKSWWASALSEKNPLISKLFGRIYRMVYLQTLLKADVNKFVVISSDPALREQIIRNYSSQLDMKYCVFTRIGCSAAGFLKVLIGIAKQLHFLLIECLQLILVRANLSFKREEIISKKDLVVLRTWLDHRNYRTGEYKDPYFKSLADFLSGKKKNVLVFGGMLGKTTELIKELKRESNYLIIPTNYFLKFTDIIKVLFMVYFKRPSVGRGIKFEGCGVDHLIRSELKTDIILTSFFNSLIQYYSCLRLAESVSIERFIYTFENYGWEKLSILGLRGVRENMNITGFQHAFVSKNSFKYFLGKEEAKISPLPNRIVTMGRSTMDIMQRYGDYSDSIFRVGCALRQEYIFDLGVFERTKSNIVFVPLTITVRDSVRMIRFIHEAGLGGSKYKVYLRFHPATDVNKVIENLGFTLPENFLVSADLSIEEDIKRCDVVLYTWTTVCLEALRMGRPVIHVDVNYPYEVDPLFECNNRLKEFCSNPSELIEKIERLRSIDDSIFHEELNRAQEYLNCYLLPVTEESLMTFLN